MKTKIQIILFFYFSLFTFHSADSQPNTFKLGFTGSYPINWDSNSYNYTYANMDWSWYSELSLNLWSGWQIDGRHTDVINDLITENLNGYFQPDTMIYRAAYGRISLFEAESSYTGRHRYTNHHNRGVTVTDNWMNEEVHAQFYDATGTPYDPPEAVLTVIDENKEQVISGIPTQKVKNSDDPYLRWYIKPRIRIDRDVALYGPELPVVRIVVLAYDGNLVDSLTITTKDFRQGSVNNYDGSYLEDYFIRNMIVTGDQITRGSTTDYPNPANSAVDYQIYWYGEVDLWIDYVKVMDNTANDYYSPDPTIRNYLKRLQSDTGK